MIAHIRANKERYKWLIVVLLILAVLIALPMMSYADVGNNVNHSGGGSSHSSSSSSYGGGSGYTTNSFEIYYLLSMIMRLGPIGWIILIAIIVLFFKMAQGSRQSGGNYSEATSSPVMRDYGIDRQSIELLMKEDTSFSEQMFISQITNMFMRLQLAWMNKKWEEARPFESDALFNMHNMQLMQYISSKTTNRIEDICVKNTELEKYRKVNDYEYLDVIIDARFIDYIMDDESKAVIRGSKASPVNMKYRWKMMRKQGVKSTYAHVDATECPNCGANISINQAGKCEYCGSIVTRGDYDWVLSEIEVISQY